MPTSEENEALAAAISALTTKPVSVSGDAGYMARHSLNQQIEAHRYFASVTASKTPSKGIRFMKIENGPAGQ